MLKISDVFILTAVMVSFIISAYLWFIGNPDEGIFTALWVPSILAFGLYFKLALVHAKVQKISEKE